MRTSFLVGLIIGVPIAFTTALRAQGIDLTIHDVGLAIGDKPDVTGLRINFRDHRLERVNGINLTMGPPYAPDFGTVNGLALGLPATGAGRINGITASVVGASAEHSINGIGFAGLGLGSDEDLRGIMIGGLGVGAGGKLIGVSGGVLGVGAVKSVSGVAVGGLGIGSGGTFNGIGVGGLGIGAGGDFRGIGLGGIGVGSGQSIAGIALAGIGVGASGTMRGISAAAIGVGAGGSMAGIFFGGLGVGSGGDITGITIAGVGIGAGGRIRGLTLASIGIGAPRIDGLAAALTASALETHAIVIAPAYFKLNDGGSFNGASISAVNRLLGQQHGLTIGIFNYARELDGVQLGLINVSDNGGKHLILPIAAVR